MPKQVLLAEGYAGNKKTRPFRRVSFPLLCGVRRALENAKPPKCFEGLPITMVAAALTSVTFMGFTGMAENLFH